MFTILHFYNFSCFILNLNLNLTKVKLFIVFQGEVVLHDETFKLKIKLQISRWDKIGALYSVQYMQCIAQRVLYLMQCAIFFRFVICAVQIVEWFPFCIVHYTIPCDVQYAFCIVHFAILTCTDMCILQCNK